MSNSIALVVRTRDHAACIGETLRLLNEQSGLADLLSEVVHIDIGSTDGTVGIVKQFQPEKLIQLEPGQYFVGKTLNLGMQETTADWVIFLSGDACPDGKSWLQQLAAHLTMDKNAAAVASLQKPRRGCRDVYAYNQLERFSLGRSHQLGGHHSIAATAIRREVWEREKFREDLPACHMEEWSSRVEALGWRVLLAEEAVVLHSRNYSIPEAYHRARAQAIAWTMAHGPDARRLPGRPWRGRTLRSVAGTCVADFRYSFRHGNALQWPFSVAIRFAQYLGEHHGFTAGGSVAAGPATAAKAPSKLAQPHGRLQPRG